MILIMVRTFKYPLGPNRRQEAILSDWIERCRAVYNAALEQRREWWRMGGKTLTYMDQTVELTELRASDPLYREVPVEACRSALRSRQRAFDAFFRRVKQGQTPGYPRFKGQGRLDSFGIGRPSVEGK